MLSVMDMYKQKGSARGKHDAEREGSPKSEKAKKKRRKDASSGLVAANPRMQGPRVNMAQGLTDVALKDKPATVVRTDAHATAAVSSTVTTDGKTTRKQRETKSRTDVAVSSETVSLKVVSPSPESESARKQQRTSKKASVKKAKAEAAKDGAAQGFNIFTDDQGPPVSSVCDNLPEPNPNQTLLLPSPHRRAPGTPVKNLPLSPVPAEEAAQRRKPAASVATAGSPVLPAAPAAKKAPKQAKAAKPKQDAKAAKVATPKNSSPKNSPKKSPKKASKEAKAPAAEAPTAESPPAPKDKPSKPGKKSGKSAAKASPKKAPAADPATSADKKAPPASPVATPSAAEKVPGSPAAGPAPGKAPAAKGKGGAVARKPAPKAAKDKAPRGAVKRTLSDVYDATGDDWTLGEIMVGMAELLRTPEGKPQKRQPKAAAAKPAGKKQSPPAPPASAPKRQKLNPVDDVVGRHATMLACIERSNLSELVSKGVEQLLCEKTPPASPALWLGRYLVVNHRPNSPTLMQIMQDM
ncbi:hypothetical protein DIPPA_17310 [Diplonema papillatum]|nr:hypothetical protein DIPPA_17310 [Diplonema papillatum]